MLLLAVSLGAAPREKVAAKPPASAPAPAEGTITRPGPEGVPGFFVLTRAEPPALPAAVTKAFVIPIQGAITDTTADTAERKVVEAQARGAELVIFDFNTPGGAVSAAQRISTLIKQDLRSVRTVAFVNSEAISAGALLALACHEIVMVPNGKLGDAAPITMMGALEGLEREKIETYLRTEFRDSAATHGYAPALAESMVSADLEIWLVRNLKTNELQYVRRDQWSGRVRVPPGVTTAPSNPDAPWEVVQVVVPAGKLLTMTTPEARELGFVHAVVDDWAGFDKLYGISAPRVYLGDTWSEKLTYFLTSPAVTGVLVLLVIFFGYTEMHTPGFGVAGALALACLAVLFGSRFLTGLAAWWEIAIFVVGVGLLLTEIFITPGFGVLGTIGLILCAVGLVASLVGNAPNMPPVPQPGVAREMFLNTLLAVSVGFILACVLCVIAARTLPKAPVAGRLVLASAPSASQFHPSTEDSDIHNIRPGDEGVVESYCRPAGKARFGEALLDVMTEGEFLPPGTAIAVLRNEGNRLLVRRVT